MKSQGKKTPRIVFHNEPKLFDHEVDKKFNERRVYLVSYVKDFIDNHDIFNNKEVNVTFSHKGISSLVSIIETSNKKLVLKIPLSITSEEGEGQFLKVWEQAGVKVPHIIEEGKLGEHSYSLMEYVDAPLLDQIYNPRELLSKGIYFEMGKILRKMHEPKSEGYGKVVNRKAEYSTFNDWLNSPDMQKKVEYVKEHMILNENEHGSLSTIFDVLIKHVGDGDKSSYCHFDYSGGNIFATDPITVFDPRPRFNNRYIDLGQSSVFRIAHDASFPKQLIDGYFGDSLYSKKVLHASILLNSYMKFPYWHKTKKLKLIQNVKNYLSSNKHLLEK